MWCPLCWKERRDDPYLPCLDCIGASRGYSRYYTADELKAQGIKVPSEIKNRKK